MASQCLGREFTYEPFPSPKGYVRLISLLPRSHDGMINISMQTANLEDVDDKFDALSYVWGPEGNEKMVNIDGSYARLRLNLWEALNHCYGLEDQGVGQMLWVDALCINQLDDDERGVQVQQMGNIFSRARRVLAWLGQSSLTNSYVDLEAAVKDIEGLYIQGARQWYNNLGTATQNACISLMVNEYWQRVWIAQEMILARDASIIIGTTLLPSAIFGRLNAGILMGREWEDDLSNEPYMLATRRILVIINVRKKPKSLLNMFQALGGARCSDSKDQIYGLLGISLDGENFPVDYTITNAQLFWEALRFDSSSGGSTSIGQIRQLLLSLNVTASDVLAARGEAHHFQEPKVILSGLGFKKIPLQPDGTVQMSYDARQALARTPLPDSFEINGELHPPSFYCHYSSSLSERAQELLCVDLHFPSSSGSQRREQLVLHINQAFSGNDYMRGILVSVDHERLRNRCWYEPFIYLERHSGTLEPISKKQIEFGESGKYFIGNYCYEGFLTRVDCTGSEAIEIYESWRSSVEKSGSEMESLLQTSGYSLHED